MSCELASASMWPVPRKRLNEPERLSSHQRGKARPTGPLSDIRYEFGERSGFVRSVVVRGYEESDDEFSRMIVQEEGHSLFGGSADTAKRMLAPGKGPYLVVLVKEIKR